MQNRDPNLPGQGYLRQMERQDFEERLGEVVHENRELRRQITACKTQLAKMYQERLLSGGRRGGSASPQKHEPGSKAEEEELDELGGRVDQARERERAAREAWQRAKSPGRRRPGRGVARRVGGSSGRSHSPNKSSNLGRGSESPPVIRIPSYRRPALLADAGICTR